MKIWNFDHTINSNFTAHRVKCLYININDSNVIVRKIIVLLFGMGFAFTIAKWDGMELKNQTTERALSRQILILIPAEVKSGGAYGK